MYMLGIMYGIGGGLALDWGKAKEWYEKAAAAGNTDAMYMLGLMYAIGLPGPGSYIDAKQWYGRAAAAGDSDAAQSLKELKP